MLSPAISPFARLATLAALLLLAAAPSARAFDLWPLAEVTDERTMILYPLYVHEGDFMLISPFYARTNEGRDHHVLWPMFKMREGKVRRVTPIYFAGDDYFYRFKHGGTTKTGIFPLYMQTRATGLSKTVVPLLYYNRRTDDAHTRWIIPYFHSRTTADRQDMVLPLFYRRTAENESDFWLAPFYRGSGDDGQSSSWLIFPLFFHSREPDEVSDRVPLLFHYVRGESGHDFWLFPFGRTRKPESTTTLIFPIFRNHRRDGKEGVQRSLWVAPWYRAEGPSENGHGVLPLYLYTDRPREHQQTLNILWPLFRRTQTRDEAGKVESYHRRFAIFSDAKEKSGKRTFRILGFAIVERDT